jgi:peroxiredoxin
MTAPGVARHGEMFPEFTLPDIGGSSIVLESYRGRTNLVLVFAGDEMRKRPVSVLLQQLAQAGDLTSEAAQVLVVVTSRPRAISQHRRRAFPVLLDVDGTIHRKVGAIDAMGRPAPAVFITDRFREIYAAYLMAHTALPDAQEILDWLVFINIQCPECGVSEWPTT